MLLSTDATINVCSMWIWFFYSFHIKLDIIDQTIVEGTVTQLDKPNVHKKAAGTDRNHPMPNLMAEPTLILPCNIGNRLLNRSTEANL